MRSKSGLILVAVTTSLPAFAEVTDKMPSITELWLEGIAIAALMFTLGRLRRWTAVVASALALLLAVGSYQMVNDKHVGVAVRAEQGTAYVAAAYGSAALCLLAAAAAAVSATRSYRQGRRA